MVRRALVWAVFFLLVTASSVPVFGDDADVLPKGVWNAKAEYQNSFPIKKRYGPDGNTEDLAVDFNKDLNSGVFELLAPFDPITEGLGLGPATIGRSNVTFKYTIRKLNLSLNRGVTDKLSLGVSVPYVWARNEVTAYLDTTNANMGINPAYDPTQPPGETNSPLIPIIAGGTPLSTQDVQNLLGAGFGYKPVQTWEGSSFGDMEVGGRYQYLKSEEWRLAFTGGVRLPTGKVDDPDSLVDISSGDGAYALLFRFNNDYTGVKDLVLNVTLKYDWYIPTHMEKRVPDFVNQPITANKENVKIQMGGIFEIETYAGYEFVRGWIGSLLYRFAMKEKDKVTGNLGLAYGSLEEETNWKEHVGIAGISYTTIPLYIEKKFPVPLTTTLSYRTRFAGKNNLYQSEYINLALSLFF